MTNTKRVRTCAFVNLKPGTGKSTCTAFTSSAWHTLGEDVLSVDADPGASLLRWADISGGFPWAVMGYPKPTIRTNIVTVMQRSSYSVVGIDCPQMEDHEKIVRPVLEFADLWVIPLAPSPIELDRMVDVGRHMDAADRARDRPGRRIVLLNRTNRLARSKYGPDAETAEILTDRGYLVLDQQVPHSDTRYRQSFGTVPDVYGTPFLTIAETLLGLAA